MPIHWGTYWPHAMGRVYPERLVEPPAAFAEYASELAPDVRVLPTEVGTTVEWPTAPDGLADWAAMTAPTRTGGAAADQHPDRVPSACAPGSVA